MKNNAGMRDVFAHHFGSIDYEMDRNTSVKDMADLESFCKSIIK